MIKRHLCGQTPCYCKLKDAEPDEDGACKGCGEFMSLRDGCDPTDYCDNCAQELVVAFAQQVEALRAAVLKLPMQLRCSNGGKLECSVLTGCIGDKCPLCEGPMEPLDEDLRAALKAAKEGKQ